MDHKPGGMPAIYPVSDSEVSVEDLELQQFDFDHYILNTSSDTDSSINDRNLDESFQQIKHDLEQLQSASPRKTNYRTVVCDEPSVVVEDEFKEININDRFDVMKDRIRKYRSKETETLRQYIIELNNTLARVTNNEGKIRVKNCID